MTEENLTPAPAPETPATGPALFSGRNPAGLAGEVEKKKRKYTARKTQQIETDKPPMSPDQAKAISNLILNSMVKPPLAMVARQYDPIAIKYGIENFSFALGPEEETALGFSLEQVLQTIPASSLGKWFPWIALIMTAGTIGGARVMVALKINKAAKETDEPNNNTPDNSGDNNGAKGKRKNNAFQKTIGNVSE